MTWSRPRATLTPRVIFSRSWPSVLMTAMRRFVPPRSTPMEKSGMGRRVSLLALGAVVAAAAGDHDALNVSLTDETRLGLAAVDAMLELEKSFFAIGVHIVGDRGTP